MDSASAFAHWHGRDRIDLGPIFYTALLRPFLPFSVYICPPSDPARFCWQYKVGNSPSLEALLEERVRALHISRPLSSSFPVVAAT